jgi:molybdopterin-guanine dinucleotide biosynthesis protein A
MNASTIVSGLVLAGGRSQRMQRDKALLPYRGETQLSRVARLLAPHVDQVYVSVREDQRDEPERARWPQIVDAISDIGPAAGILAAQAAKPQHAWLVVAVDLPQLDAATLAHLMQMRDTRRLATAYRSSLDDLPEPLCAIWEPASHAPFATFIATGRHCPRKFLINHDAALIDLPSQQALHNVNTPEEYAALTDTDLTSKR